MLAALIGGRARAIFLSSRVGEFATTEQTLAEVLRYIPELVRKAKRGGLTEADLYTALAAMPVRVYEPESYKGQRAEAERRIAHRDPDDVEVLALALHRWSTQGT
jgi:predicted nucleic acid-binding protein